MRPYGRIFSSCIRQCLYQGFRECRKGKTALSFLCTRGGLCDRNGRKRTLQHVANRNLSAAKKAKQDEFYTQMNDIQAEINAYLDYDADTFRGKTVLLPCDDPEWSNFTLFFAQNFERLGLKKLISTSYAPESKTAKYGSLFEYAASQSDATPKNERGKIFVLDHDVNANGRIDFDDLEWEYLKGDGDFRSDEVSQLRDEADIIVTNPPFSMFREFLAWILAAKDAKRFLIIGNMNAITYKEVFPLIMGNNLWLGESIHSGDREFGVPDSYPSDRRKYRIKEIVRNDGTSVYYIQYKWFIIWRTYKARQRTEVYEYHVKNIKLEYKDIDNAYAMITHLICERNNIDSKKKNKTKYHYFFKD